MQFNLINDQLLTTKLLLHFLIIKRLDSLDLVDLNSDSSLLLQLSSCFIRII